MPINQNYIYLLVFLIFVFLLYLFFPKILKRILKWLFYSNPIASLLRGKFLGVILPGVAAAYYLSLDIWGDKWPILSENKDFHSTVFKILITISLTSLIIRAFADWVVEEKEKAYILFLQDLSVLTTKLVKSKLDRFKQEAAKLSPNTNTFKKITHPEKQINLVLTEIDSLFKNHFDIKEKDLSIVIIRSHEASPNKMKSYHAFNNHKTWQRTKAKKIIENESSLAFRCLKIGEAIFIADKAVGAKKNEYFMSKRDTRKKSGSVFCYPSITKTDSYIDNYIICISTYGKMMCDPDDEDEITVITSILNDICRRIDLELTLHSIKNWQYEYCTKPK